MSTGRLRSQPVSPSGPLTGLALTENASACFLLSHPPAAKNGKNLARLYKKETLAGKTVSFLEKDFTVYYVHYAVLSVERRERKLDVNYEKFMP